VRCNVKLLTRKIGLPVISQTLCSLTNFIFNVIGISVFFEDISLWFLMSFINIFIQSINRSAFLELLLLRNGQYKAALWKCHLLAISVNLLGAIYLILNSEISKLTVFAMCLMFCIYQSQDILRYVFLTDYASIVTISDFLILLLLIFQFFANINIRLTLWSFIFCNSITFFLGLLILVIQFRNFPFQIMKVKTYNGIELSLFVSNFCVFFFSILIIIILYSSLSNTDMIDYRIVVLLLSPLGALIRLDWIKQITEYVGEESRTIFIRKGFKLLGIFFIFLQIELFCLFFLFSSHFNYLTVICLTLGVFTMALNVWSYPLLIKLRRSGSFSEVWMIICGNTLAVSIYCFISKPNIDLALIFNLSLGVMMLQTYYLFNRYAKKASRSTEKENS